jgi:hypothetical protein
MRVIFLVLVPALGLLSQEIAAWRTKSVPEWTVDDAHQILTNSPWAKTLKASIAGLQTEDQRREGGNMGQETGIGYDGLPDDRTRAKLPKSLIDLVRPEGVVAPHNGSLLVQLRWERALPIRVAEMKAGVVEPPTTETEGYSLAVYGIPPSRAKGDPKSLGAPLKRLAALKRQGKQDIRPLSVEVFQREDGVVIVYLFPLSAEISKNDKRVEFDAQIGRIGIAQSFNVEDMRFQGNLEM